MQPAVLRAVVVVMRTYLAVLLVAAGCGGRTAPRAPDTAAPAPAAPKSDPEAPLDPISTDPTGAQRENALVESTPPPNPVPETEPDAAAATSTAKKPLRERLLDVPGAVPG